VLSKLDFSEVVDSDKNDEFGEHVVNSNSFLRFWRFCVSGRRFSDGMAKKRKSENAALDEVEKTLYTSFCTAANSISQLYTQAQNQQKIAFQAGERHAVVST